MVESKSAEWKRIYQEALQETDQEKLIAKICAADATRFLTQDAFDGQKQPGVGMHAFRRGRISYDHLIDDETNALNPSFKSLWPS
jgi:hypothetical protein